MDGLPNDHNEMGGIVVVDPPVKGETNIPVVLQWTKPDFESDISEGLLLALEKSN